MCQIHLQSQQLSRGRKIWSWSPKTFWVRGCSSVVATLLVLCEALDSVMKSGKEGEIQAVRSFRLSSWEYCTGLLKLVWDISHDHQQSCWMSPLPEEGQAFSTARQSQIYHRAEALGWHLNTCHPVPRADSSSACFTFQRSSSKPIIHWPPVVSR